ncbi:hypothetical protein DES53_10382 [Roseimicrobium gellanilyticum]|uniref:DNA-directed RNA polymerase subunit 2 hybrid-binding domain-containing protein n=1 Tax=Roseimicrobium gellanilyticum TaxID=748857 RepID=A0A366HNL3_9BACT|nr:hypothetical protein [Roseimicrobium gellanilyticum]RBP45086.1 hypothetical protein DES53_10382 [Roseimicrobium gellanilyticum]
MEIEVTLGLDERGEPEEFTSDLFPLFPFTHYSHLGSQGLPTVGTVITPGMVLVGKIGTSAAYGKERMWTKLEYYALSFEELHAQFAHLFVDRSVYADESTSGVVKAASMQETASGQLVARVVMEKE